MALSNCGVSTSPQGRELKEHGTPLFPAACYHDDLSRLEIPWHWHDELEAVMIEAGSALVCADGKSYPLQQGEGCFINSGVLHGIWSNGQTPCRLRSVVFHPRLVGGSMDSIFWQGYLNPLLSSPLQHCVCLDRSILWHQEALCAVAEAWQACVEEQPGYEFSVRERLSQLVLLLTRNRPAQQNPPSAKALRSAERIKVMLQYIQTHLDRELTSADIALSAAVSESECLRCFRSMIGSTPIQYVKQVRIQKAAELLASTRQNISDIGARCGFQEMSYFAKTFRELKGCTPSAYRRRAQSE